MSFIIRYRLKDGREVSHNYKQKHCTFVDYASALREIGANKHGYPCDGVVSKRIVRYKKLSDDLIRLEDGEIINPEGKTFLG